MTTTENAQANGLDSLSAYLKQESTERRGRGIPPLDKWHPERCADMDLVIKANGEWWHEGAKITRQSLVDLFATVLWREGTEAAPSYYLKTPVEKLAIKVEDVPFLMIEVNVVQQAQGAVIELVSSTGDVVVLDDEHPLQMRTYQGEDRPYIPVRFGMLGLIARPAFMHLVKLGGLSEVDGRTVLTLQSGGKDYQLSVPS